MVTQPGCIFHDIGSIGAVYRDDHDLGAGLGEQGFIHGIDMFHGIVRQNAAMVVNIGIGAHNRCGYLTDVIGFSHLSQQDAGYNGQHHDDCRNRALFE